MLFKNYTKIVFVCLILFIIPLISTHAKETGSSFAESSYKAAKKKYVLMRVSETKMKLRDNWIDVIDAFLSVYLDYPDSDRGDDSLYMVGRLYEELYEQSKNGDDLRRAEEAYEKLIQNFPASSLSDDACFNIAEIYQYKFRDPVSAYKNYQIVVKRYPKGDMKPKAEERLKELSKYGKDLKDVDGKAKDGKGKVVAHDVNISGRPTLTDIRTSSYERKTRVVFDLSENAEYTYGDLNKDDQKKLPYRIYVDIKKGIKGKKVKEETVLKKGAVTEIRTGSVDNETLRVVLDLDDASEYKIFPLKSPDRIVVDISPKGGGDTGNITKGKDEIEVISPENVPKSTEINVVIIDAGHGGKDPGAVGPTRYYEKTANYKIAKYLKEYLKSRLGMTVIMTRNGDKYLTLKERTALANKSNADLFISIHNNASRDRRIYGVSTYYLAVTSDRKALAVAARENDTTIERLTELDYILTDLMVSAKRNESSLLATFVQDGMVSSLSDGYNNIKNIGVLQGPFWVLVGAQMPSILVECSYISNVREESRLKSDRYLKKVAYGIYKGFEKYINEIDKAKENW